MPGIFADIKARLNTLEPISGIYFSEVLHADGTLFFGDQTDSLNKFLEEIEIESPFYNMNLNCQKCVNLTTNRKMSSIKFRDGSLVPRQRHATYLGIILIDTASNTAETQNHLAKAIKTCAQSKLFLHQYCMEITCL